MYKLKQIILVRKHAKENILFIMNILHSHKRASYSKCRFVALQSLTHYQDMLASLAPA